MNSDVQRSYGTDGMSSDGFDGVFSGTQLQERSIIVTSSVTKNPRVRDAFLFRVTGPCTPQGVFRLARGSV